MISPVGSDDPICPRCRAPLRPEPIPVTLRETILILVVLIFTGTTVLRARESIWAMAAVPLQILAIGGLGVLWLVSHRDRTTPRCISCTVSWRPEVVFAFSPVNPTMVLLAMFGLSVFTVLLGLAGERTFYLLLLAPLLYPILRQAHISHMRQQRALWRKREES